MIKNFSIFKAREKKNDKSPDYNISIKNGDKYVNVGGCWIKEGKSGKYISCKLSNGYKEIRGFSIVQDSEAIGEEVKEEIIKEEGIPF